MQELCKQFKALSHPNRLAIFQWIRSHELSCNDEAGGCTIGDIAQEYDLALSTVSHHIKELKEAELVVCVQRGKFSYCHVNQAVISALQQFFSAED